ncbi:DDB1- and CUL4-associated factor 17-like protein, partial [Leptotrombidium deliense]
GRLYFDNFKECFTLSGDHYLPHKLYNLDLLGHKRIVDSLIYTAPIHKTPMPSSVFAPMFLALTDDNWLLRYHNLTGALLEQIYLGNKSKFLHIDWETQGESIVLQSRQGVQQSKILQTIAVFSIYPLEFVCAFDVSKDIFGNDVKSANISEGLLIIGSGSGVTKQVRLYSLRDVMRAENFVCKCKLDDECDLIQCNSDNGERRCLKVGIDGIPVNISLKETPSLLFKVNCCEEVVYFGGYPWHYIYSPAKEKGVFELRNLETHEVPENGRFHVENNSLEPDSLSFHVDDSGRLIYSSAHDITFYKLNDNKEISKIFVLSITPSLNDSLRVEIESPPKLYTPRHCRRKKNYSDNIEDRTVLTDDYENELEFFSLLGVDKEAGRYGKILMFDNDDGSLVKEFDVGFKLHEVKNCYIP